MSDLIFEKYSKLPKEIQVQVHDYIDFLMSKYQEKFSVETSNKSKSNFGSAKGLIIMSDDFNAPLEDFKEYS